jgi:hypothetical protein
MLVHSNNVSLIFYFSYSLHLTISLFIIKYNRFTSNNFDFIYQFINILHIN